MNIDELKDAWSQDEPRGMKLPISTGMLGKSTSAVSGIRKKMLAEFIALLVCYAIIVGFLFSGYEASVFTDIIKLLLFCVLLLNGFYYYRFYLLYKAIGRYDLNMKNSVRKILYELELNTEIYKTYSFSAMPLSVLTAGAFIAGKLNLIDLGNIFAHGNGIPVNIMLLACITIMVSYAITYFCISVAVRVTYGKYISELKQVMQELGEDD